MGGRRDRDPPRDGASTQNRIDGGALAAGKRCDSGMAVDGRGEAMAMADGRGARSMVRALTVVKLLLICFGFDFKW